MLDEFVISTHPEESSGMHPKIDRVDSWINRLVKYTQVAFILGSFFYFVRLDFESSLLFLVNLLFLLIWRVHTYSIFCNFS